ncbi:MAG: hypothetical protein HY681_04395 [Chloroflexi bacterium]|nr:hypothetical protein [Chloroflexota bacterium]
MTAENPPADPGLCARCQHLRRVHSQRGATFYLCRRSATDPHYPKYPHLPVLTCPGYEPTKTSPTPQSGGE